MESWQPYDVTTRNVSINSENKIHDDVEAKRFGFRGGLVPGTTVYAHMTTPVVARYGAAWLGCNTGDVVLLKPAYEGDRLRVTIADALGHDHPGLALEIFNAEHLLLAKLETAIPGKLPPLDPLHTLTPDRSGGARVPISWDAIVVGKPMMPLAWNPTVESQKFWCDGVSDDLPIYKGDGAPVHPGLILQAANHVFSHHFVLKPWIHIGSRVVTRGILRVGQQIEVRAQPVERWEKKGHEFTKLYCVMVADGQPLVEVWHSAIFTVRPAA
jgi:hypothetical protein